MCPAHRSLSLESAVLDGDSKTYSKDGAFCSLRFDLGKWAMLELRESQEMDLCGSLEAIRNQKMRARMLIARKGTGRRARCYSSCVARSQWICSVLVVSRRTYALAAIIRLLSKGLVEQKMPSQHERPREILMMDILVYPTKSTLSSSPSWLNLDGFPRNGHAFPPRRLFLNRRHSRSAEVVDTVKHC